MKDILKIAINESNKIKYETLNEFSDSIFREVYAKAFLMVQRLIRDNCNYRSLKSRGSSDEYLKLLNSEQIYNCISFLGERGMGKSSSMLSFATALEHECGCFISEDSQTIVKSLAGFPKFEAIVNGSHCGVSFSVLDYVDATMLDQKEGILDVILAKMWDKFETESGYTGVTEEGQQWRKMKEQFIRVRDSYLILNKMSRGELENGKEISSLDTLHKLAASMNLRNDLKALVAGYLDFINARHKNPYVVNFLVITIDDIDMGAGSTYKLLEQLRRFLTIPQVLIFLSADLNRLKRICNNFEEGLYGNVQNSSLKTEQDKFINDYLGKLLPINSRNYMPNFKELGGDLSPEMGLPVKSDGIERLLSVKDAIIYTMAGNMELYFDGSSKGRHILQPASMRTLINYFSELMDVIEEKGENLQNASSLCSRHMGQMLQWFKNDLEYRLSECIGVEELRRFFVGMFQLEPDELNERLVRFIHQILRREEHTQADQYWKDFEDYGSDFSLVLTGCYYLESVSKEYSSFCSCVLIFYTWLFRSISLGICQECSVERIYGTGLGHWIWPKFLKERSSDDIKLAGRQLNLQQKFYVSADFMHKLTSIKDGKPEMTLEVFQKEILKIMEDNMDVINCIQMLAYRFGNTREWNIKLEDIPIRISPLIIVSGPFKCIMEESEENEDDFPFADDVYEEPEGYKLDIFYRTNLNMDFGIFNFANNLHEEQFQDGSLWLKQIASALFDSLSYFVEEKEQKEKERNLFEEEPSISFSMYREYFDETKLDFEQLSKSLFSEKCKIWKNQDQALLPNSAEIMYGLEKQLHVKVRQLIYRKDVIEFTKEIFKLVSEELGRRDTYFNQIGAKLNTPYKTAFDSCPYVQCFINMENETFLNAYKAMDGLPENFNIFN